MYNKHIGLDQSAEYEIKIQGRLKEHRSDWFLGEVRYTYEVDPGGETATCLCGTIADQAALHGLLAHIRDLGLTLLYVDCLSARQDGKRL